MITNTIERMNARTKDLKQMCMKDLAQVFYDSLGLLSRQWLGQINKKESINN